MRELGDNTPGREKPSRREASVQTVAVAPGADGAAMGLASAEKEWASALEAGADSIALVFASARGA